MKVLIGSDTYYPDVNGASYFTQRLAKGMHNNGHEVHVLCASRGLRRETTRRDGVTLHGLRSAPVPLHAPFRFCPPLGLYRDVRRTLERLAPDVVHVQSHFLVGRALVRAARSLDVPLVATNHFMPDNLVFYLGLPERIERSVMDLAWRDFARVFDKADAVAAPTPFAANLAEEKGISSRVIPISCGMDLSRFSPENSGERFRERYRVSKPSCLYVGRLDAEKHIDELISALPLVRESVDAQLVIVGDGHQREELSVLARELGVEEDVIFPGALPDSELPGAYASCDVFCNASVAELQSLVTMEAMATGKPVVAADSQALPLLAHDGENGYTFEPGDIATLARRLTELLTDAGKRESMGDSSLEIVASHSMEQTLDSYEALYTLATGDESPLTPPDPSAARPLTLTGRKRETN